METKTLETLKECLKYNHVPNPPTIEEAIDEWLDLKNKIEKLDEYRYAALDEGENELEIAIGHMMEFYRLRMSEYADVIYKSVDRVMEEINNTPE